MRKLLYSILLVFASFSVSAQMEVVEGSFKEVPGFVILDHDKTDDNDVPIAVIKVKTQNINDAQRHKLLFQGNMSVYLDWEFKVGEVWLYLTYHADYIKISHPDFSTTEFVFPFDMKPLSAYELILTNKSIEPTQHFGIGSLSIKTIPIDGADIEINGIKIPEKTPYFVSAFPIGNYTVSVYKNDYAKETKNVKIENGKQTDVTFKLQSTNPITQQVINPATHNDTEFRPPYQSKYEDINSEGMWLPMFVERLNYVDMQKMGLQLTPEELYSINNSSLKDAIVGLSNGDKPRGFFCTGEIVSENSLLFTNHHCGYSSIAALSTVEHDYLNEGFWARNFSEELPAEGVSASFLVRMEDVTEQILGAVNDTMDWTARQKAISAKAKELEAAASEDGKLNPVVKGFFEGNEYYMFVYKTYTDVRLVGTAPQSIGKFGGDTDNWMWPRHTCDFSVFRVYADANGEPAAYSADNKPLTPKHHLPISLDGVQQDDFTMIWGFPGSTERYMTSYGIDYNVDTFYPIVHDVFKAETDVMDEYMMVDQAVNISYADNKAGLANTWKNFEGQMKMLRKNKVAERKAELEAEFTAWVNASDDRKAEYGEVLGTLEAMYRQLNELSGTLYYPNFVSQLNPMAMAAEFVEYATIMADKESKKEDKAAATEALKEIDVDAMFAGLDARVEKKMLVEVMKIYGNQFATEELPSSMQKLIKKYKGDWAALASDVYDNSMFSNAESMKAFIKKPNVKKLAKDPAFQLMNGMMEQIYSVIPAYRMANMVISENNHLFVKGLREFYAETQPGKILYPDANSTLRMSYGIVKNYEPEEDIIYDYYTTANGVVEKYIPGDFEFDSPKRLIELIEKRDFGQYADKNGELITCFLSTNDITGGNSGSPIMNGKGELIGLAFDRNWEAMSGDVNFEPTLQRTVNVDIRYVLFIIDKLSGATNLIDELDIHKAMPEPIRVEDAE